MSCHVNVSVICAKMICHATAVSVTMFYWHKHIGQLINIGETSMSYYQVYQGSYNVSVYMNCGHNLIGFVRHSIFNRISFFKCCLVHHHWSPSSMDLPWCTYTFRQLKHYLCLCELWTQSYGFCMRNFIFDFSRILFVKLHEYWPPNLWIVATVLYIFYEKHLWF